MRRPEYHVVSERNRIHTMLPKAETFWRGDELIARLGSHHVVVYQTGVRGRYSRSGIARPADLVVALLKEMSGEVVGFNAVRMFR